MQLSLKWLKKACAEVDDEAHTLAHSNWTQREHRRVCVFVFVCVCVLESRCVYLSVGISVWSLSLNKRAITPGSHATTIAASAATSAASILSVEPQQQMQRCELTTGGGALSIARALRKDALRYWLLKES